ncbi:MAG: DUF2975 domain-containing protein [Candidatus Thiodiazotropha sp.]
MTGSNPPTQDKHTPERIRLLSRLLATCCLILITALPIVVVAYWAVSDTSMLAAHANLTPTVIQGKLSIWQRIVAGVLSEIPLVLFMIGLWQARRCFKQFSDGKFFSATAVRSLSRFAGWTAASVIASVATTTLVSVVITLQNPVESRTLTVSFGSDQLLLLFFAGMVWLMASVIHQGQKLAEENASFI